MATKICDAFVMAGHWYFRNAHSVHDLTVHLIFIAKFRGKIFAAAADSIKRQEMTRKLTALFQTICSLPELRAHLISVGIDGDKPDHMHLVVRYPPDVSVSDLVQRLKSHSSQYWPEDMGKVPGRTLWSPSYFASSNGRSAADYARQDKKK